MSLLICLLSSVFPVSSVNTSGIVLFNSPRLRSRFPIHALESVTGGVKIDLDTSTCGTTMRGHVTPELALAFPSS